jgi:hypothetical protein
VYPDVSEIEVNPESHARFLSYCSVGGGGRGDCGSGGGDDGNSRQETADSKQQATDSTLLLRV